MTQTEARDDVARRLSALSVACDALLTAAFQDSDMRWRRLRPEDKTTWPPCGRFLMWGSGGLEIWNSTEMSHESSGRHFYHEHSEMKWPPDGWWMPMPPAPPAEARL